MSDPQFIYEDRVIAREGMNEVEVGDTGTVVAAWLAKTIGVRWDKDGQIRRLHRNRLLMEKDAVKVERLTNKYHCEACDESWESEWCCACDDECPSCGKDFSPDDSVVEETFVLRLNKDDCPVCDEPHAF